MRMGKLLMLTAAGMAIFAISCKQKQHISSAAPTKPVAKPSAHSSSGSLHQEFKQKLNISEKDIKENKLYSFSEEWYGAPYRYGGCDKRGVDCSCFTNLLYQHVYNTTLARSANDMFKACDNLDLDHMAQGDLVFFKIGSTAITHVGVYLKGKYFIHASTSKGVTISSLDEAYYKKFYYCSGKVKHL